MSSEMKFVSIPTLISKIKLIKQFSKVNLVNQGCQWVIDLKKHFWMMFVITNDKPIYEKFESSSN